MDLNKGVSTPIAILLIVVCSAVVGVLIWQQFKGVKKPEPKPEPTEPQATTSEEEPPTPGPEENGPKPSSDSDKTINVSLTISSDNKVIEDDIEIATNRPTSESILENKTGDYELRILDYEDNLVWSNPFSVSFDYEGPAVAGEDHTDIKYEQSNLSVKIPYEFGMQKLHFYHQDSLIYSTTLPVAAISGSILDHKDQPISDALIEAVAYSSASTASNKSGNYRLGGLEPGEYAIRVIPPEGSNLKQKTTNITLSAGEVRTLDFNLQQSGSIAGKVMDKNGNPVSDVKLYLSGYETPRYATHEDGSYRIPNLEAGEHEINIHSPEYDPWYICVDGSYIGQKGNSTGVEVNLEETTNVRFAQTREACER